MKYLLLSIPLGFFFYYFQKSKQSLVYICMWPVLFAFGEAIYLPISGLLIKSPLGPIVFNKHDVGFIILTAVWWYVRQKRSRAVKSKLTIDVLLIYALILLYFVQPLVIGMKQGYFYNATIINNKTYFILPASILVWFDLIRRFARDEIWIFLDAIINVTSILCLFYVLSGLGIKVYPYDRYQIAAYGQAEVIRDFLTFPYWTIFSLSFLMASFLVREIRRLDMLKFAILSVASVFVLTRSLFIMGAVAFTLALIINAIPLKRLRQNSTKSVVLFLLILIVSSLTIYLFPNQVNFFRDRMERAMTMRLDEPNLDARITALTFANDIIHTVDPVWGLGGVGVRNENVNYLGQLGSAGYIFGDSMWFELLLITGWSGVIALTVLLLVNALNAAVMSLRNATSSRLIGLTALIFIVWTFGRSFASEGFFTLAFAGTLPIALLLVEKQNVWAIDTATESRISFFSVISWHRILGEGPYRAWRLVAFYLIIVCIAYLAATRLIG